MLNFYVILYITYKLYSDSCIVMFIPVLTVFLNILSSTFFTRNKYISWDFSWLRKCVWERDLLFFCKVQSVISEAIYPRRRQWERLIRTVRGMFRPARTQYPLEGHPTSIPWPHRFLLYLLPRQIPLLNPWANPVVPEVLWKWSRQGVSWTAVSLATV